MEENKNDEALFLVSHHIWIKIVLFMFAVILCCIYFYAFLFVRWVYKRRLRQKQSDMVDIYQAEEQIKRDFDCEQKRQEMFSQKTNVEKQRARREIQCVGQVTDPEASTTNLHTMRPQSQTNLKNETEQFRNVKTDPMLMRCSGRVSPHLSDLGSIVSAQEKGSEILKKNDLQWKGDGAMEENRREDDPPREDPSRQFTSRENHPTNVLSRENPLIQLPSREDHSRQFTSKENHPKIVSPREDPSRQLPSREDHSRQFTSRENHPKIVSPREDPSRQLPSRENHSRQFTSRENHPKIVSPREDPSRQLPSRENHSRQFTSRENHPKIVSPREDPSRQLPSREDHPENVSPNKDPSRQFHSKVDLRKNVRSKRQRQNLKQQSEASVESSSISSDKEKNQRKTKEKLKNDRIKSIKSIDSLRGSTELLPMPSPTENHLKAIDGPARPTGLFPYYQDPEQMSPTTSKIDRNRF